MKTKPCPVCGKEATEYDWVISDLDGNNAQFFHTECFEKRNDNYLEKEGYFRKHWWELWKPKRIIKEM